MLMGYQVEVSFTEKKNVFASLPIKMDPKQNYTDAYGKDR